MATWTTPKTWSSEPLLSTDMNTHIRDNLEALKNPPTSIRTLDESSDYQTTSTSFTDVDGTNLKRTITPADDTVLIGFFGTVSLSVVGQMYFDVLVDDATYLGGGDGLIMADVQAAGEGISVAFQYLLTGLTPEAAHSFRLQWKVSTGTGSLYAAAGTTGRDVKGQFFVREVS